MTRLTLMALGLLLLAACQQELAPPLLLIVADRAYLGADVCVDGRTLGQLAEYDFNVGIIGQLMAAEARDSPLRGVVGLNLNVQDFSAGQHEVWVRKSGVPGLKQDFLLPFMGSAASCSVFMLPSYQRVGPECAVGSSVGFSATPPVK